MAFHFGVRRWGVRGWVRVLWRARARPCCQHFPCCVCVRVCARVCVCDWLLVCGLQQSGRLGATVSGLKLLLLGTQDPDAATLTVTAWAVGERSARQSAPVVLRVGPVAAGMTPAQAMQRAVTAGVLTAVRDDDEGTIALVVGGDLV
jgi:hypothetical protein